MSSSTSSASQAFPKIPGYRLESVLGTGATGVVYRAVQLAVDRPVALKILRPELVGTKRAVRRLQREARTAARLAHPSIISAIDMGEVDGQWWYAMELVVGRSLAQRLRKDGRLSEREALRLFVPLADALQHAYECGVVHRDIKPPNILIDTHGRARLVDLGLAFAEDDPMLTKPGGTLGTPHYISPEQARDPSTADTRSDIWSLGATMYQAVCGRPPFEGESVAEILSGVLYHRVPEPRLVAPNLSRGMALVLRKCLTRDPDRRYQEPSALMADLERLRERRAPGVRASSLDPVDTGRPEWFGLAVTLSVVAVLGLGGLLWWSPWNRAEPSPPDRVQGTVWPELARVRTEFEKGRLKHKGALLDVERMDVPAAFQIQHSQLRTDVLTDLDRVLADYRRAIGARFQADLADHKFERCADLLERGAAQELRTATGFVGPEALPPGNRRDELLLWRGQLRATLDEERGRALDAARAALRAYFEDRVRPDVQALARANRFKDASQLIGPPADAPRDWLLASSADLRGLDETDLSALGRTLEVQRNASRSELRSAWATLNGELLKWIRATRGTLFEQLDAVEVRAAATKFESAFADQLELLGIDRAQVPAGWDQSAFDEFDQARAELEQRERELIAEYARDSFEEDQREMKELCAQRAYASAAEYWGVRLSDPLLVTVRDRIALRRRECQLLADFLQAASDGVLELRDREFELYLGSIPEKGRIRPSGDPLLRGFELLSRVNQRTVRKQFYLVQPEDMANKSGYLVRPDAIEEFAGLPASNLSPEQGLVKALFRYYEGDLDEALQALPIGDSGEGALVRDLRGRILAARTEQSRAETARTQAMEDRFRNIKRGYYFPKHVLSPEKMLADIDAFEAEFDDLLGARERADLREIERELKALLQAPPLEEAYRSAFGPTSLDLSTLGNVTLRYRLEREEVGAFRRGRWGFDGSGWTLPLAIENDGLLFDEQCPTLPLVEPLDANKTLKVRLTFEPVSAQGGNNALVVSLAGFHVALRDEPGMARFLIDTTTPRDVLTRLREGKNAGFEDFVEFDPTRAFVLEVEVSVQGGKVYAVALDGERLGAKQEYREPTISEPTLAIRSARPLRLVHVQLNGRSLRR